MLRVLSPLVTIICFAPSLSLAQQAVAQQWAPAVAEARPLVLPKTASLLPSILMTGIFALLAAMMIRGFGRSGISRKRRA